MTERHMKLRIWGSIPSSNGLEQTPTHELSGPYSEIIDTLRKLFPAIDLASFKLLLFRATFETQIAWHNGWTCGLELLIMSGNRPVEPQIKATALDDKPSFWPKRAANGQFVSKRK